MSISEHRLWKVQTFLGDELANILYLGLDKLIFPLGGYGLERHEPKWQD